MKAETQDAMQFFSKALERFGEALAEDQSNPLAIDGSIQRFEFCFELGWKLIKKLLMDVEGIEALSPKRALQFAYQVGWIDDEVLWLKMLNDRNLTSHTYREDYALEIYSHLASHLVAMKLLKSKLEHFE
jgi:nucleotidyltransferase substrate binding protein (TIGR01987 family)